MQAKYKYENFRDIRFPVYASFRQGAGRLVAPHFHEAVELIRVVSGVGVFRVNTQMIPFSAGDILFVPPRCIHMLDSTDPQTVIEGLVFELSIIPELPATPSPERCLNKDVITHYVLSGPLLPEFDHFFSEARRIYCSAHISQQLEMLGILCRITSLLLRHYPPGLHLESYHRLQPVMDYIHANFMHSISLCTLSKILNICDDHLIRLFRSATGRTPGYYILDIRLEEAMKLLTGTDLSVTEIAFRTGFSSPSYMARVFRQRLRFSPAEYRKNRPASP